MIPASREDFADYCLRKLGAPTITINVAPEQVDDRIDEALAMFAEFHCDGSQATFFKHQVTADDIANRYVTVPSNIVSVMKVFDVGSYISSTNLFSLRYQIVMNDIYSMIGSNLTPYYMSMFQLNNVQEMLVGMKPTRFSRIDSKCYVDMDWAATSVGQFIVFECYSVFDSATYSKIWADRWLQNYATASIKKNWGSNLTKFKGQSMLGGTEFNGEKIYDDAVEELEELEKKLRKQYSVPLGFITG